MSLSGNVWPGVMAMLQALVNVPPAAAYTPQSWPGKGLAGIGEGEQFSVPESPMAWLINDGLDRARRAAADLEATTWNLTIRLMADYTNDAPNAEQMLMPLIEQITIAYSNAFMLGDAARTGTGVPNIRHSQIRTGAWGYIFVNNIQYRSVELHFEVLEKVTRPMTG
jgi:hypothetical protein